MTVMVFDPSYSNYMQSLGIEIARLTGKKCEAVLSSPAYFFYCQKIKRYVYKDQGCDNDVWSIGKTANELTWGQESIAKWQPRYQRWLTSLFKRKTPSFCIFHNEKFLWCALGIALCRENKIPYIVLERGAFRPFTSSMDPVGTNADAHFKQLPHKNDLSLEVVKRTFRLDTKRPRERFIYSRFLMFLVIINIFTASRQSYKPLLHKEYSFRSYARIAMGFIRQRISTPRHDEVNLPEKFLFVALQRPGDTQLSFSDNFPGVQNMIDQVCQAVNLMDVPISVIFKAHPYDVSRYDTHGHFFTRSIPASQLANKSRAVLTFNSTVGFEALMLNVPVICLGESFFTRESYVYKPHCHGVNELANTISEALKCGAKEKSQAIMANVLSDYQVPGDFYEYDKEDIENAACMAISYRQNPTNIIEE